MSEVSYLILGAGPAGLTMAQMLRDQGIENVTILEASGKVGGKCLSDGIGDHVVEFGTCYAIWSHKYVLRKMKDLGIKRNYLKAQRIDNRELLDYIRDGSGPPFIYQALKYVWLRWRLMSRASGTDAKANELLAQPAAQWLKSQNLGKVERMMHRVVTSIGYGYLNRVPLLHAMRWVDFDMLVTGLIKFTVMPDKGWQNFWDTFARPLNIHLNQEVVNVRRETTNVEVSTKEGQTHTADYLINTIPLDDFCRLTADATQAEEDVAAAITWSGYTTTLLSVEKWPHDAPVNSWSETCATDARDGQILYARYECEDEDGRLLFSVGQSSAAYSKDELTELALFSAIQRGAQDPRVIRQVVWQYMPTYSSSHIRDGLLETMHKMQGENRTYHTGSSFSHEAVSTICAFNSELLSKAVA